MFPLGPATTISNSHSLPHAFSLPFTLFSPHVHHLGTRGFWSLVILSARLEPMGEMTSHQPHSWVPPFAGLCFQWRRSSFQPHSSRDNTLCSVTPATRQTQTCSGNIRRPTTSRIWKLNEALRLTCYTRVPFYIVGELKLTANRGQRESGYWSFLCPCVLKNITLRNDLQIFYLEWRHYFAHWDFQVIYLWFVKSIVKGTVRNIWDKSDMDVWGGQCISTAEVSTLMTFTCSLVSTMIQTPRCLSFLITTLTMH